MVNLPILYSKQSVLSNTNSSFYKEYIEEDPPIEKVISAADIKDKIMEYLGAVLSRCWFDKKLMVDLEYNPHRALRHLGILLPDEMDIKLERSTQERPRLVIYEYNKERTFRKRICYLQMIMLAGN